MHNRKPLVPAVTAAMTALASLLLSSCNGTYVRPAEHPLVPIHSQVALLNTAAYPEDSYAVEPGDTPRAIARKLGVDYQVFADANGFTERTVLQPGHLLVVPRVRPRTTDIITARTAGSGASAAVPRRPSGAIPSLSSAESRPPGPEPGPVSAASEVLATPGGVVRAIAAGRISQVHLGYLSLGNVVIIETATRKTIYTGGFSPSVAPGREVVAGSPIGTATPGREVTVSAFEK